MGVFDAFETMCRDRNRYVLSTVPAVRTIFLFILLQVPALRALTKYCPFPELLVPALLASTLCGTALLVATPDWLVRRLDRPSTTWLIVLALSVAMLAIYPWADGLKHIGRGSDQDDALILAGRALINGNNPYRQLTYLAQPIHPGPGWVMLAMPFTTTELYPLFFPSTVGILIWVLRDADFDWIVINRFLLLLLSSLLLWELAVVGSDYPPFALLLLSAVLLLQRQLLGRLGIAGLVVIVGLLATFRLPFIVLPVLLGFVLITAFPQRALITIIGGLAVSITLHGLFYVINSDLYPPIELLRRKAASAFSIEGASLSILLFASVGTVLVAKRQAWSAITLLAIGLGAPWAIVSIAELIRVHGRFSDWGGASFLMIALPALVYSLDLDRRSAKGHLEK